MEYKITDIQSLGDTITTTVDIVFDCGQKKTVAIPHFRPESRKDIFLGIENRVLSEEMCHKSETKNKKLVESLSDAIEAVVQLKKEE